MPKKPAAGIPTEAQASPASTNPLDQAIPGSGRPAVKTRVGQGGETHQDCLLYTSPSPRDS